MISAFACVAHVINSDSANEEDQMDGDNEIIGIDDDDSETEQVNEDDDGSYDSSNHPNSLESPENYHPIHKPQLLGFTNKTCIPSNGNSNNNRKFNGNCSSNDRFSNKSGQVNVIKPLPPPLSTIPRPTQQPPPPPTSTSLSSTASTLVPKIQQNSSKPNVPVSVTKPITAKDHLYETIYPSNIRLTRDSRYFVDYQNYNSILSQPVDLISPLDSSKRVSNGNGNSADSNNDLSDISQNSSTNSPINSKVNMVRRPTYTSSFAGNSNYKNGRLSTSSTSSSLNQKQKNYHQVQRSTLQPYNHQNHLPGLNSSSLCKPSLSSSSSLLSPPLYTSPSETNQGNQRLLKKSDSIHQNHLASSNSSSTPINRPTFLPFNKPVSFPSESYDQVDNKINNKPSPIINEINVNGNSSATLPNENDKNASNQVTAKNAKASDLKPDQVYPNPITMPIISRANVRSTEEYATVNKTRSIKSLKSATLTPSTPISYNDEIKLLSKDDSILNTKSKANESNGSPMSLSSSTSSPLVSLLTPSLENTSFTDSKVRGGTKSKHKDKSPSNLSPSPSSTTSSSSRSFLSKFFSLTHVISRTFSVEKIDKHRQTNIQGKGTLIKSAVSTPALSSARPFNDLNGNNQVTNQFNSTRTLIESGCTINNQENVEPVSLPIQSSGSKSLQTKSSSSSSFVRAFKNRLSLRRSKRKVKVKVDVTRTKSDPRGSKVNRYEDDKMLPKQSMKEETVFGSIVSTPGDYMKIVEIHRPQGKPFGFFVARGTVNNIKGIFISRIDSNGEKVYQGLLEIGDRLIEIDGIDVTEASVIQVNQLMSNKTKLTLKIVPFTALNNKP
uniref:PDZ domain-containing protein n=2 Tax=Tetranychus urticae TaxID=32264 RepID=T1K404_TETUR